MPISREYTHHTSTKRRRYTYNRRTRQDRSLEFKEVGVVGQYVVPYSVLSTASHCCQYDISDIRCVIARNTDGAVRPASTERNEWRCALSFRSCGRAKFG